MVRQDILGKLGVAAFVLVIALVYQPLAKADSFAVTFETSLKMPPPNALPGPRWHLQFSTGSG